jgi:tetratricopeptide (TPR) repeat protein
MMTSGKDMGRRFLWGLLVPLLLTPVVHANILTKVHTVESESGTQLIFSFTRAPSYKIIRHLEDKLVIIHLSRTTAKSEYVPQRFTSPVIEAIEIDQDADSSLVDQSEGALRIAVLLKTSAVTVMHQSSNKPAGLTLTFHQLKSASKSDEGIQHREARSAVEPKKPDEVGALPQPSGSVATIPTPDASPLADLSIATEAGSIGALQEGHRDAAVTQPDAGQEHPTGLSKTDQSVPPTPQPAPALPAAEEIRAITGNAAAAEVLALLELYFHRPTAFAANPSLLWTVAAAYVDLGLYEEGDAIYRKIAERTDNPALQAAALLKRGKIALLQGAWANAERWLREFVSTSQHSALLAEAHEALGDTLMTQEQFADAAESYGVALQYTPEADKPFQRWYKLGRAQHKAGQWQQAATVLRQAVDQLNLDSTGTSGPRSVNFPASFAEDLFQQLGDSLYKIQHYPEAVVAYQRVLEQTSSAWQTGWTLYHLGRSYEALGQPNLAALTYQELARQADAVWSELGQQAWAAVRRGIR